MSPEVVLLTTTEVAKRCRVDTSTVRRWVAEGLIPYVTLPGGLFRFYETDIQEMLTASRADGSAA